MLPNKSLRKCAAIEFPNGMSSVGFVGHCTTPKALQSAVLMMHELGKENVTDNGVTLSKNLALQHKKGFLVVDSPASVSGENANVSCLASVVRPFSLVASKKLDSSPAPVLQVNQSWYSVWQIKYATLVFGAQFLSIDSFNSLLESLGRSKKVGKDVLLHALSVGMETDRLEISKEAYNQVQASFKASVRESRSKKPKKKAGRKRQNGRGKTSNKRPKLTSKGNHKSARSSNGARPSAKLIYDGLPTIKLDYPGGWPKGWTQKTFQRQSGDSKGAVDSYFFSPQRKFRLRSKVDVLRFLGKLEECNGDEHMLETATKFRAA